MQSEIAGLAGVRPADIRLQRHSDPDRADRRVDPATGLRRCRQMAFHVNLAINISAVQFKKGNLFDVILCALVESGLAPERLELEITETVLLENQEEHLANIRQ